jgi:hypothetical protein
MVSTAHRTFVPSHLTEMQYNGGTTIWDNDDATRRTQHPSDTMTTPWRGNTTTTRPRRDNESLPLIPSSLPEMYYVVTYSRC